jgi:endonuclease-3
MTPPDLRQATIDELTRRLRAVHAPRRKPVLDPVDELILTILSQSTTDTNRDRAWDALRTRYPDRSAILDDPPEVFEETIRVAGLAGQKSAAIRSVLERLIAERGAAHLDHLDTMTDGEALAYLSSFPGVGVKTAACVLCFSLHRDIMPVDTHVHRIARRLGLVPDSASAKRTHELLNELVPPETCYDLHLMLIDHGRRTCTARAPDCGACSLIDMCPSAGAA